MTPSDPIWHVTFDGNYDHDDRFWRSCVISLKYNGTFSDNHVLTPCDPCLTFDPKLWKPYNYEGHVGGPTDQV